MCCGGHQELNYWSIFYDFYESLEQKNTKWVIGFQRSVFKRLMFGHSITSIIRKIFDKSILLPSGFPFDALTLIGFSRRLIKSMDTTPLKYLKVRFFKTIRDKIKIKIRIVRIFRWEKTRCTWKGIIFHCHFRRNDPQYRRYPRRRITPLLARLQVCWSFIVFWTVSFRILL